MNAAIALALDHWREFSGQPRTWASLEIALFTDKERPTIRLKIGPRWPDGQRELETITRTYYLDDHARPRFITYAEM